MCRGRSATKKTAFNLESLLSVGEGIRAQLVDLVLQHVLAAHHVILDK